MKKLFALVMALVLCMTAASAMAEVVTNSNKTLTADTTDKGGYINNGSSYTLDLGGKTLTLTEPIWIQNGTLTVKNGTIKSVDDAFVVGKKYSTGADATGATSLIIESSVTVEVTGKDCVCVYINGTPNQATVTTSGKLYSLNSEVGAAIMGNGSAKSGKVIVNGGVVYSKNDVAIFHPQNDTLKITGGEISGNVGIEIRNGELIISGNPTIKTHSSKDAKSSANGNGSTAKNAAIAVSPHSNTTGTVKVSISDNPTIVAGGEAAAIYAVKTKTEGGKAGASAESKTEVSIKGTGMIDGNLVTEDQQSDDPYFDTPNQKMKVEGGLFTRGVDPAWVGDKPVAMVGTGDPEFFYPEEGVTAVGNAAISKAINESIEENGASKTMVTAANGSVKVDGVPADVQIFVPDFGYGASATINGIKIPTLSQDDIQNGNIKPYIVPSKAIASLPQTGDNSSLMLWVSVMAMAVVGFVASKKVRFN